MSEFRELSAIEIDTVSGGMMNNGQGDSLQTQTKYGGPPDHDNNHGNNVIAGLTVFGLMVGCVLGL